MIKTERLTLEKWQEHHFPPFAALHADPVVMADLGGTILPADARKKFDRYREAERKHRISRWAVETIKGEFIGYAGVVPRMSTDHPLGAHYEIGWRFSRSQWGNGYATESAQAAIHHAFAEIGLPEVVSYTSSDNLRSQAVMCRLGLERTPSRDFTSNDPSTGIWHGLVWTVINQHNLLK